MYDNEIINIGKRICLLRKENNLTQQELADKIDGLTVQMVCGYEKNKATPGIENLIKISNYFNVSLDYLCLGHEKPANISKIENYAELIRCINLLLDTGIFTINSRNGGISCSSNHDFFIYNLDSYDGTLYNYDQKFKKLYNAKNLLDEDVYNTALNALIDNYNDVLIKCNPKKNIYSN